MTEPTTYRSDAHNRWLQTLGTFWAKVFTPSRQIQALVAASLESYAQTQIDLLQAIESISRVDCPVYRHKLWHSLTITRDDLEDYSTYAVDFDGSAKFGEGEVYGRERFREYRYPVPKELKNIRQIVDTPYNPDIVWTLNIDYYIEDGFIIFSEDPVEMFCTGADCDKATLWLFGSDENLNLFSKRFAVAAVEAIEDPDNYKRMVNAIWDLYIKGSNYISLVDAISTIIGAPTALHQSEVVKQVVNDPRGRQIVTDMEIYNVADGVDIIVAPGDTIYRGQPLTDEIGIVQGATSPTPNKDTMPVIMLTPNQTAVGIKAPLLFSNEDLATEILTNPVRLRFPLGGNTADITAFWNYAESVAETFAEALNLDNENLVTSTQLPDTVNPALTLLQAVPMAIVVSVFVQEADNVMLTMLRRRLQDFFPPHNPVFLMVWLTLSTEKTVPVASDSGGSVIYYSEDAGWTHAMNEGVWALIDPMDTVRLG